MKTLQHLLCIPAAVIATAGPALAAPGPGTPQMGLGAWLFIGFCAFIFVAQLVPALFLLTGIIKGVFSKEEKSPSVLLD